MGTREPTVDELRLAEVVVDTMRAAGLWTTARDEIGLAVVRAIIDAMRPMTERQWEELPGLGKPWKDLSSREVWGCFLESLSPKISEEPGPQYPKPGEAECGKILDPRWPAAVCILKLDHAGPCDDGIPF